MSTLRGEVERLVGAVQWTGASVGYCRCPGQDLHTRPTGKRDCRVYLDRAPTIFCFHSSCSQEVERVNAILRSRVGKLSGNKWAQFNYLIKKAAPSQRELLARRAKLSLSSILEENAQEPSELFEQSPTPLADNPENDWRLILQLFEPDDPKQIREYRPPIDAVLIGDFHIVKGAVFVIGGAPGVGKSRASVALAVAGAIGKEWFGLRMHRNFKTLIIQNENGLLRLSNEFADISEANLNDAIRISPPPPYGLAFDQFEFRAALEKELREFQPDLVLIDPWNAVARDDNARDYLECFRLVRSVLPPGDAAPALGIVAHTRKPKNDERSSGRGLLKLLAGSYVLGSVPRAAFILQPASEDTGDDRVVFTCCKNNDGELGVPSGWTRKNGLFEPVPDFDWKSFGGSTKERTGIAAADLAKLFDHGKREMTRKRATAELQEQTGCSQSAAYNALSTKGRYADSLVETDGLLAWVPPGSPRNSTESDGMDSIPRKPQGGVEMELPTASPAPQDQPSA